MSVHKTLEFHLNKAIGTRKKPWFTVLNNLRRGKLIYDVRKVIVMMIMMIQFIFDFSFRRCPTCRRKKSLRTGSFFAEFPRFFLGKILLCIYLWSLRELRTVAAQMLSLTKNTVGNIYALLRHYCGRNIQDRPFVPFGGRVYVTKCDESQFNHKSKVTFIRYKIQYWYHLHRKVMPLVYVCRTKIRYFHVKIHWRISVCALQIQI